MSERGIALLFLDAASGREDDFQKWAQGTLLPESLSIPGIAAGQLFAVREQFLHFPPPPARFALLYELEDVAMALEGLEALVDPAALPEHTAADAMQLLGLEEFRPEVSSGQVPADLRERSPRHVLVFFLGPVAGREEAYHEWYDRAHIPGGVELDGFVTGQRFRRGRSFADDTSLSEFAAVYEIEGDLDVAVEAAKGSASTIEHSDAAAYDEMKAFALTAIGPLARHGFATSNSRLRQKQASG